MHDWLFLHWKLDSADIVLFSVSILRSSYCLRENMQYAKWCPRRNLPVDLLMSGIGVKTNEELQSANFLLLFFGYLCLKIVNGWIHKMYFSCSISKIYFSVLFFLPLIVSFSLFSNIFLSFTKVYLNIGFGEIILWDHSKRTCDLVSTLIEITSHYFHLMKQ